MAVFLVTAAAFMCMGCVKLEKPKLPDSLKHQIPIPSRAFEELQQLLHAEQFEKAYARFTPEYRERYAPDIESFMERAEIDAAKIAEGRLAEPPMLCGNMAQGVFKYGEEYICIYFIFDPAVRNWLITSQEHYESLMKKGDQSSPEAALQSFLRLLLLNRALPAYRMLATEFTLKNGIISVQVFVPRARAILQVFRPDAPGKSWRVAHARRTNKWAAFIIEFSARPNRPMPLFFLKKLDKWYLAFEPVGDAAAAIPFLKECGKLYAEEQKKNEGKPETGE
ncbi:MAG: hypothetical protein ACYS8W_00940 [Planctomycetota bacterium]